VVLTRSTPEESVLDNCKTSGNTGSYSEDNACLSDNCVPICAGNVGS